MKMKLVTESILNEKFTDKYGKSHYLKKGLVVKIKPAEELKKTSLYFRNDVDGYWADVVQNVAGKTFKIKQASRPSYGGGISKFSLEDGPLEQGKYMWDDFIIDEVISGNEDVESKQKERRYQQYLELKKEFEGQ